MPGAVDKFGLKLISVAVGIPVGLATRKVVERTWVAARPDAPSRNTTDPDVRWADAIGWAALSAAGIVVAELVTRAASESIFRSVWGTEPPPSKKPLGRGAGKKVAKADPAAQLT